MRPKAKISAKGLLPSDPMAVLSYVSLPDPAEWRNRMLVESPERLLRIFHELKEKIVQDPQWNKIAQITLEVIRERKLAHMVH